MKKNNKKKGFTLIELIVVIAILGILAMIAVPSVSGYIGKARLSRAKNDAKIISNAVDTFNADADIQVADGTKLSAIFGNANITNLMKTIPKEWNQGNALNTTVGDVRNIAAGAANVTVDSSGNVTGVEAPPAT